MVGVGDIQIHIRFVFANKQNITEQDELFCLANAGVPKSEKPIQI